MSMLPQVVAQFRKIYSAVHSHVDQTDTVDFASCGKEGEAPTERATIIGHALPLFLRLAEDSDTCPWIKADDRGLFD